MTSNEFVQQLRSGKSVHCVCQAGSLVNVLSVYPYNEMYVLHWEEHHEDDYRNRRAYLRDEMRPFEETNDVLVYVESCGYPASGFAFFSEGKLDLANSVLKSPR